MRVTQTEDWFTLWGRTRTLFGRSIHTVRSGIGKGTDTHGVVCTRMSGSSDVKVLILAAICEETETKEENVDERHICKV
jgi:hypothetical protein